MKLTETVRVPHIDFFTLRYAEISAVQYIINVFSCLCWLLRHQYEPLVSLKKCIYYFNYLFSKWLQTAIANY